MTVPTPTTVAPPAQSEVLAVAAANRGRTELDPSAERVWFLERQCGREGVVRRWLVQRVHGRLVVAALEEALRDLVRRHTALQTGFVAIGDLPERVVRKDAMVSIPVVEARASDVDAVLAVERDRPFAPAEPPLLRVCVVRLEPDDHVVVVVAHTLLGDNTLLRSYLLELGEAYRARVSAHAD